MANTENFLTVFKLDDFVTKFSYFAFKSTSVPSDINPAHAIVFQNVPEGNFYKFANNLTRLLRLFYISSIDSSIKGRKDLIVEFPNSRLEDIFLLLQRCKFGIEAISYPQYAAQIKAIPPIETTNRYEVLNNLDDCDSEEIIEAMESSLEVEVPDIVPPSTATEYAITSGNGDNDAEADDWVAVVRRKFEAGRKTCVQKRRDTPCQWGIHCVKNSACPYAHSEEERKIFRVNPNIKFRYWKTNLCKKCSQHTQPEQQKRCPFAHSDADAWCLKCKSYGHFTNNCAM